MCVCCIIIVFMMILKATFLKWYWDHVYFLYFIDAVVNLPVPKPSVASLKLL